MILVDKDWRTTLKIFFDTKTEKLLKASLSVWSTVDEEVVLLTIFNQLNRGIL